MIILLDPQPSSLQMENRENALRDLLMVIHQACSKARTWNSNQPSPVPKGTVSRSRISISDKISEPLEPRLLVSLCL